MEINALFSWCYSVYDCVASILLTCLLDMFMAYFDKKLGRHMSLNMSLSHST